MVCFLHVINIVYIQIRIVKYILHMRKNVIFVFAYSNYPLFQAHIWLVFFISQMAPFLIWCDVWHMYTYTHLNLYFAYKRKMCYLLFRSLAHFSKHDYLKFDPFPYIIQSSLCLSNNIFHIDFIFKVHSSVDEHLGWFHILAIVNHAAITKDLVSI